MNELRLPSPCAVLRYSHTRCEKSVWCDFSASFRAEDETRAHSGFKAVVRRCKRRRRRQHAMPGSVILTGSSDRSTPRRADRTEIQRMGAFVPATTEPVWRKPRPMICTFFCVRARFGERGSDDAVPCCRGGICWRHSCQRRASGKANIHRCQ